ncbi:MAG: RNA polymerase sporulation sigma factor SigE [Clostridia bacterium]|nr:RNA polymerase sporulation sigma factor SigE [Clostridia bacterium]
MFFSKLRKLIAKMYLKLKKTKGVFYVNGPDLLPAPLSISEENECIERLSFDEEAKSRLIEHNLRLVVYIAKKFENTGIGLEDLTSIGSIGLIKAVNSYKADKNIKLATYASRCIENEILMYIRKYNNRRVEISFDEPLNIDWDGNELLLSDVLGTEEDMVYRDLEINEENKVLQNAILKLTKREQQIINMRFGLNDTEEMTQKEVADYLGISQSYISRLEKKIFKRLKKEIESKI